MKKFLFLALFAATALVSCEKNVLTSDVAGTVGDVVTLSVSAQTGATTRALDDYITDENVEMMYYLEIYRENSDGDMVRYYRATPNNDGFFSVQLVSNQAFKAVAWADYNQGYYNTDPLTAVTVNESAYAINDLTRDAYAGVEDIYLENNESITMWIDRPFARINVHTNDWAAINPNDSNPEIVPASVEITYTDGIYDTYNVLDGDATGNKLSTLTSEAALVMYQSGTTIEDGDLSADYLFAKGGESVISFTQVYKNSEGTPITDYPFTNIPIKTNYQTNISGSIITNIGDLTITIDKEWEGTVDKYLAADYTDAEYVNELLGITTTKASGDDLVVANSYMLAPNSTMPSNILIPVKKRIEEFWNNTTYNTSGNGGYTIPEDWETNGDWTVEILWYDATVLKGSTVEKCVSDSGVEAVDVTVPGGSYGNILFAVKNDDDIVWSWHVWVSDYFPYNVTATPTDGQYKYEVDGGEIHRYKNGTKGVTNDAGTALNTGTSTDMYNTWSEGGIYAEKFIMDRCIGSISELYCTESNFANVLMYQFGRKDPFPWKDDVIYNTSGSLTSANVSSATSATIYTSVQNPKRIYARGNDESWTNETAFNQTGIAWFDPYATISSEGDTDIIEDVTVTVSQKSIFDPSPLGWMVPVLGTWTEFDDNGTKASSVRFSYFSAGTTTTALKSRYYYPGGVRGDLSPYNYYEGYTAIYPGYGYRKGQGEASITSSTMGNYWCCQSNSDTNYGMRFVFTTSGTSYETTTSKLGKSNSLPIRPVQEF